MYSPTAKLIPGHLALSSVRNMVPLAHPGSVYVFQGEPRILYTAVQELINRFALQQPVQVVVGGNRISFDHLPLLAGEQAGNIYAIMDRIYVSRAETCYQMQDALAALEATPTPLVITDMLESFYEDDLTSNEVTLLLLNCLERIKQLSQSAPVLICARQDNSRPNLMDLLESNSDVRFYFEPLEDEHQSRQIIIPGMD